MRAALNGRASGSLAGRKRVSAHRVLDGVAAHGEQRVVAGAADGAVAVRVPLPAVVEPARARLQYQEGSRLCAPRSHR